MDRILNLATYYILPLVELSENSFGDEGDTITTDSNFINCYVTDQNYVAVKVQSLHPLSTKLYNSPYYFTDFDTEDGSFIIFRVSKSYLDDVVKFREGKYSQFSTAAKSRISIFTGLSDKTRLIRVLSRDKILKKELEDTYDIKLSDTDEVKSMPHDENFIILNPQTEEHESA